MIDESRKVCLKRYEKEGFNPNGWQRAVDKIYGKHSTQPIEIDEEHKLRLTALWDWRDSIARKVGASILCMKTLMVHRCTAQVLCSN